MKAEPIAYLDEVVFEGTLAKLRGWAISVSGRPAAEFMVRLAGDAGSITTPQLSLARRERPDVVVAHPHADLFCGFELELDALKQPKFVTPDANVQLFHRESKDHEFLEFHGDYLTLLNRALIDHVSALPAISDEPYMPLVAVARFMELVREARCYLEYGTGGTTISARRAGVKTLVAVESDPLWLEAVQRKLEGAGGADGCHLLHVDIGRTGNWGFPTSDSHWSRYANYPLDVWRHCRQSEIAPTVILIDGRFRVACLLASMLFAPRGSRVLFDDYLERPYYHAVERFLRPQQMHERLAEFHLDTALDRDSLWLALIEAVTDTR